MKLSPKVMEIIKNEFPNIAEQAKFGQEEESEIPMDIDVVDSPTSPAPDVSVDEPAGEEVEVKSNLDVPDDFPSQGVNTVIEAMVTMGLTSAIRDMSDDLEESYPELDGLAMDIQLRLLGSLGDREAIESASSEIAKLIKFGREKVTVDDNGDE